MTTYLGKESMGVVGVDLENLFNLGVDNIPVIKHEGDIHLHVFGFHGPDSLGNGNRWDSTIDAFVP